METYIVKPILAFLDSKRPQCAYNKNHGNAFSSGLLDIDVCYLGRTIYLEVKQDSGSLRPNQRLLIKEVRRAGGIAEVVYSVETVRDIFAHVEQGKKWKHRAI